MTIPDKYTPLNPAFTLYLLFVLKPTHRLLIRAFLQSIFHLWEYQSRAAASFSSLKWQKKQAQHLHRGSVFTSYRNRTYGEIMILYPKPFDISVRTSRIPNLRQRSSFRLRCGQMISYVAFLKRVCSHSLVHFLSGETNGTNRFGDIRKSFAHFIHWARLVSRAAMSSYDRRPWRLHRNVGGS